MLTLVWIEFFELLFALDKFGAPSNGYVPRPKRKGKKRKKAKEIYGRSEDQCCIGM